MTKFPKLASGFFIYRFVASIKFFLLEQLTLLLVLLPFLLVSGIIQIQRQVGPILDLTMTYRRIHEGKHDFRAQVISENEVGTLAVAFNSMLDALRDSKERAAELSEVEGES